MTDTTNTDAVTENEVEKETVKKISNEKNENATTTTATTTKRKAPSEFRKNCKLYWKPLFAILVPFILLPLILYPYEYHKDKVIAHGAYGTLIIIVYWTSEALPLAITSFLPVTLFPLLGVANSHKFVPKYFNDSIMIFVSGLLIAISFEFSNLHKRIALKVIITIGGSPRKLLLGVMLTTAVLSMWMSNTAITALMVPIVAAIMEELDLLLNRTLDEEFAADMVSLSSFNAHELDVHGGGGTGKLEQSDSFTSIAPDSMGHTKTKAETNDRNIGGQLRARTSATKIGGQHITFDKLSRAPSETDIAKNNYKLKNSITFNRGMSPSDITLISSASSTCSTADIIHARRKIRIASLKDLIANMKKMFLLSTAYAANLGGTAMITGSGTNFVAKNAFESANVGATCDGERAKFGFIQWFIFNLLPFVLNLAFTYGFLVMWFTKCNGCKSSKASGRADGVDHTFKITPAIVRDIRETLERTYLKFGKRNAHETGVFVVFIVTVLLWVFHDPEIFPGWASFFEASKPSLASAGLACAMFLFIIPRNVAFYKALRRCDFTNVKFEALLDWRHTQNRFPWGVLLVLGGGFALSNGVNASGLGAQIGEWLGILKKLPKEAMLITVIYLTSFTTEVASNTAIASILVPVLLDISRKFQIHPMYLSLPSTVASSYSFMLPVATPPNAIVYSAGKMKIRDMIIPGFVMNIATGAILYICTLSWGNLVYNFEDYTLNPAPECNIHP